MVELLAVEKRRLLAEKGQLTSADFRLAWDACWGIMVLERSWAHNSYLRRSVRGAMLATKPEVRAAFLDERTAFADAVAGLSGVAARLCLRLDPAQIPHALLAAIAHVEHEGADHADHAVAA